MKKSVTVFLLRFALIIFLGPAVPVWAFGAQVVLLISLGSTDLGTQKEIQQLQRIFTDEFSDSKIPGLQPFLKSNAEAYDLYSALKDERNVAIFWVSHAGSSEAGFTPTVADLYGRNVAPVFQVAGPYLKSVAIIGCESQASLRWLSSKNLLASSDLDRFISFNKKVDATMALKKAIQQAKVKLSDDKSYLKNPIEESETIEIWRTINQKKYPDVSNSIGVYDENDRLLGMFPNGNVGEVQYLKLNVPSSAKKILFTPRNLSFSQNRNESGDFVLRQRNKDWKIFESSLSDRKLYQLH